jgi:hypothetical protein
MLTGYSYFILALAGVITTLFTKKGFLKKVAAPDAKLSRYYSRPDAQESVSFLKSGGR